MTMEQIQAMVDTLANRLSRAVVVDDQNLQLVAVSEDFGDADPARIWSLLHRRTRPEDVGYGFIKELPGPGYVPENAELQLWRRLCVPIRCRGLLLGFIWIIDRHGDLTEGQVAEAARAAESIGLLLHRRLATAEAERTVEQHLVEQLLSPDLSDRRTARQKVLERGMIKDDSQLAILMVGCRPCAKGVDLDVEAALPVAVGRARRLVAPGSALVACWSRRAVVLLAARTLSKEYLSDVSTRLHDDLHRQSGGADCWRVSVGGPLSGLLNTVRAHRQAAVALAALDAQHQRNAVANWSELGAYALLGQLEPAVLTDMLVPEGIIALLGHSSSASLVTTVETYLDCAGDVQRTARELRVHRTTLYYRLERVEQLTGLNLRNGHDRLLVHVALKLHRLFGLPGVPAHHDGFPTNVEIPSSAGLRRAG